ncbi:MAG: 30S ribosomal protein S18 [Bacteroidetes bacterium]|nr:30S ribosomal protein S18 [Bacteroidota bacterium]
MSEETKPLTSTNTGTRPAGGQSTYRPERDNRGGGGDRRRPSGGAGGQKRSGMFRKKVCRFCTQKMVANYKEFETLRRFVTDRGKILPRRITGTCAKHQRTLSTEIKKARVLAYIPFEKK